ncbi:MAG TPA: OB-fold domain-containing protein [Devosia sp.]|jgi:uncharacterized OB-fold protein|nr:OB-fold domain-containing protein [Devosia sp.]
MADARIDEATGRYLPIIYPEEVPFWEAAKARKLILQQCSACAKVRYPVGPICPQCLSDQFSWATMSGRGVVHNYVVYHKPWNDFLKTRVPYAVVQVQLEEGPRLTTNLLGVPASEVRIGIEVCVAFEDITDAITLVQFAPRQPGATDA